MGINIFSQYEMPELHTKLVKSALQKDKQSIFKILHKYPYKPRKGFRKIDMLPQKFLIEAIIDYAKFSPELSNLILKLWFESEDILRERVKDELNNLGYEINQLNFDSNGVVWKKLNEKDLVKIDKEDGGTIYFAPEGGVINGFNPTDVTLMSIMFGWFDGSCEIESDSKGNIVPEQIEMDNEKGNDEISDVSQINSDKKDEENSKMNDNKEFLSLTEYSVTSKFELLDSQYTKYNSEKRSFIDGIKKITDDLENNIFNDIVHIDTETYQQLNKQYNNLIIISDAVKKELLNYTDYINKNYNLNFVLSEYNKDYVPVDLIKKDLIALKSVLSPVLKTNQLKLVELFEDIDEEDKELYLDKLEEIENDINENKIENFEHTLNKIYDLTQKILTTIQENELSNLSKAYLQNKSDKIFKKIFSFVDNNANSEDLFAFYFAACKDIETSLFLNDIVKDNFKSICVIIEELNNKYGNEFLIEFHKDIDLINPIISNEDGQKFVLMLSIYLHLIGQKELAKMYLWDIKKSLSEYMSIEHLVDHILYEEKIVFSKFDSAALTNKAMQLNDIFYKEGGRYKKLSSVTHKVLKDILNDNVYPELEKIKNNFESISNKNEIGIIKERLLDDNFVIDLYDISIKDYDIKSHYEEHIKTNCLKEIEEIRKELIIYESLKEEELDSLHVPIIYNVINELTELKHIYPVLSGISDKICKILDNNGTCILGNKTELLKLVEKIILNSKFYGFYFTNICCKLMDNVIDNSDLLIEILRDADSNKDERQVLEILHKSLNYTNSDVIRNEYNIENYEILVDEDTNYRKIIKLENYLKDKGFEINPVYYEYKDQKRFSLADRIISEDYERQIEKEKLTSQEISKILNGIKENALNLKSHFYKNKDNYLNETYIMINDGLNLCERVSDLRLENKIEIAKKIIKEVEYLKINKDTIENLKLLMDEFEDSDIERISKEIYLQLDLKDIREHIKNDNYESLGISKRIWKEISDSRKDDIETIIDNWINMKNKATVYEDLLKQEKYEEVSQSLIELCKSLARVCTLYFTNDYKKIGFEPFDEWSYYKQLPFVFTTKIKDPKCESLNQTIRIYVLTEQQIGSKAYINRIKDHILEKNYNLNSFSVILLIGDREKFNKINTNSTTKDLPVLDELALKKILFATETKKKPKWEFTYLLVLTQNISDIQPFKSEGSVNSEINIFVGRDNIIREMISVPKDFAIYGGRQIGKSSLLNEIKNQLNLKGFKTVFSAIQGYSDSLSAAKAILSELSVEFKTDFKTDIANFDEFKVYIKHMYLSNKNQPVAILLDEVDSLIFKENNLSEHKLIEIFRDISHETEHKWIFIFAGFKEMYLQITGKGTTYEGRRNPWANFVDTSAKQLSSIDNPESLVNEGLRNILGLEYDHEVSKQIVNYSSGHPAFLQYFCQCLVEQIKNQIDHNNRRIYLEDVDAVFNKKDDFIKFVRRTLNMNLSEFQRLLIFIAADSKATEFDFEFFEKRLKDWVETYISKSVKIDVDRIKLELELLVITGVIKQIDTNKYKFTHEYYLNILKRIEQIDKNVIEDLLKKIYT